MKRSDSILANFYNQELSKLPAFKNGGKKKKTPPVKKTPEQKIKYIDLEDTYDLDPFSKEGIEKAKQLIKLNPNTRIVCDASGCSEIAVNAAEAYGYNFNRGHAWDLGNTNPVVATNPVYKNLVGKGILPDPNPQNYSAPVSMFRPGSIIGLNRKNNLVGTKATDRDEANDSWDYANQSIYPKSRGYEHVGFMLDDKSMLHGTGAGPGHPAFYTIDTNLSDGLQLGDLATYQPVETIQQTPLQKKAEKKVNKGAAYNANPIAKIIRLFGFENGGMITDPRGQWKYPGMNTRIPGSNITMQGVPYPVLAQANNGMQTMMYPGQDYYFPGADYVDEYPIMDRGGLVKYQKKGEVTLPPIYTNDPMRGKAGKDSFDIYKEGLQWTLASERMNNNRIKDAKKYISYDDLPNNIGSNSSFDDRDVNVKFVEDEKNHLKNEFFKNQKIKPVGFNIFYDNLPNKKIYAAVYRKPHPVIYQPGLKKMVSKMEPISTKKSSYTPSLRMPNIPNIELPSVQRGKYRTSYWDPEMKDWNERAFMSQQESDQFANEMSQRGYPGSYGNVTQRVQYRDGGLVKYQDRGQVDSKSGPGYIQNYLNQEENNYTNWYGVHKDDKEDKWDAYYSQLKGRHPYKNITTPAWKVTNPRYKEDNGIYQIGETLPPDLQNKVNRGRLNAEFFPNYQTTDRDSSLDEYYQYLNNYVRKKTGLKKNGGDISIPNLRQAYYPMAYGGPMVRYMAGKMTGPNIF